MTSREDELVAWLRARAGTAAIGDDAALLPPSRRGWAVTLDHQIAGVHFLPDLPPAVPARRLLAVNLSDLAAVGAVPRHAFLALAAPTDYPRRDFLRAFLGAAASAGVDLAGGDLARADRPTFGLTLLGERPARGRWLRRGAARPGDHLWLGGTLGESAAGRLLLAGGARPSPAVAAAEGSPEDDAYLDRPPEGTSAAVAQAAARAVRRHLEPRPQVDLGLALGRRRRVAAIDVSDGLALDLARLCRESGVGARLSAPELPLAPHARALAGHLGHDALDLALGGGEDYVLLFTLPPDEEPDDPACRWIGETVAGADIEIEDASGRRPLAPRGWDHLRPEPNDAQG